MPEYRYSRKLFAQRWNVETRKGVGKGTIGVRLLMIYLLGMDKAEWIEDIWKESSLESFWA